MEGRRAFLSKAGVLGCTAAVATTANAARLEAETGSGQEIPAAESALRSIRSFGVLPENTAAENGNHLQKAIDWAGERGAALFVEPSDEPYRVSSGIVLKANASLLGVHGPVGRGTRHPEKAQPVGSVFAIEDDSQPFITVQAATQIRGIQFWYPKQTVRDANNIIAYPPTIQASQTTLAQGVTLA